MMIKITEDQLSIFFEEILPPRGWTHEENVAVRDFCFRGLRTMPRPIVEAKINDKVILYHNNEYLVTYYWTQVWQDHSDTWAKPPTHFIPLSALETG